MIIQSPPDFFARAAHGFHHGAATRDAERSSNRMSMSIMRISGPC